MDKVAGQKSQLETIRQQIDEIDEQIVDLLVARYAATEKVRHAKSSVPMTPGMPFRPGREAVILRRLHDRAGGSVPADVIERVWRAIISASVMMQADVRINTTADVLNTARYRAAIDLFSSLVPVNKVSSEKALLESLSGSEPVMAVMPMKSGWRKVVGKSKDKSSARVLCLLPTGTQSHSGSLVVLGHAMSEPTGEDETLLVTTGKLPRDFVPKPVWHLKLEDDVHLTALPGYLSVSEQPLVGLKSNRQLGLKVAGRYPVPRNLDEDDE